MHILLSNDDGISSENLSIMANALKKAGHDIRVCVPDMQRSGCSSSITLFLPMIIRKITISDSEGSPLNGYTVAGTPADCVIVALNGLFDNFWPDLVITGPNKGENAGNDIFFSGTVGAAFQSCMYGIHTAAMSYVDFCGFTSDHAEYLSDLLNMFQWNTLPTNYVYNINLPSCPAKEIKGLKICRYSTQWEKINTYDRGKAVFAGADYFWIREPIARFWMEDEGTDKSWLHKGWATLTPIKQDWNDDAMIQSLQKQFFKKGKK